ncbi:DUF87 domain-containing protein [Pseudonocardia aurantiaca]|uniref:Helicase HerA domain-containing protein n=1 Tax=Pseudonocardia aurantiaca TaxID=75290 RepID=A0ABW4FYC3_9PSEU
MTDEERVALEAVQFNSALTPEDVWSPVRHHVEGLHTSVAMSLLRDVEAARRSAGASPIGVALQGERGVGKTHMLRWVRQHVQAQDGYFFLIKLFEGTDFWRSAVHGIIDGFEGGQVDQLGPFLRRLAARADLSPLQQSRIAGTIPVSRADLDDLVTGLRQIDRQVWADCQNTLRALVLYRAMQPGVQEIGYDYFSLDGDVEDVAREEWGFRPGARTRQLVLRDLSRLLALTGPTVIAVDQIDGMLNLRSADTADAATTRKQNALVAEVADGLMELRDATRRTLTVVACLPETWEMIATKSAISAADRFRTRLLQGAMPDAAVAAAIVGQHLGGQYAEVGYVPPYDTWPVLLAAFELPTARNLTPRKLLQRVDVHVRECLESGELRELDDLAERAAPTDESGKRADDAVLQEMDAWFARLRAEADVAAPLHQDTEDERMPALLAAGLSAYINELGERGQMLSVDQVRGKKPPLHARLRQTLDERTEDEVHVAFRAIAHRNARAVQSRISSARTESGLRAGGDEPRLVLIRNAGWPTGPVTAQAVADVEDLGGVCIPISEDDLRTLAALEVMRRPQQPGFLEWLAVRRPAGSTELFRRTLPGAPAPTPAEPVTELAVPPQEAVAAQPSPVRRPSPTPRPRVPTVPSVPIGRSAATGQDVYVPLESLRKHAVVFAGSGSGKTVLLRRLVEECALHGVSAIVLDPNNDLARLGDAWPEPPGGWHEGDAGKASDYLEHTEVVVWTPGRSKGRPLAFQPLPDFAPVIADDDEFRIAIDTAVTSLIPRAHLTGRKVEHGKAVLREALKRFALDGGSHLSGFVGLLGDLPDGVSELRDGTRLAAEMADAFKVAGINDPLFGGSGEAVDPSVLLTPRPGKRARISVINFVGLPAEEQRQSFVNQLQMALFSWIKANPAGDRPLGGLFVMDEAQTLAPSRGTTACTDSTLSLVAQARKYGLGLVFATQAPRGLHNYIPGNAATQFFGYLNSGAQINAATELARAKGGRVAEISRLESGQFYLASEGVAFERVQMPMCLSHHPSSALTSEEVVRRAADGRN